jgi:hypothetical protein
MRRSIVIHALAIPEMMYAFDCICADDKKQPNDYTDIEKPDSYIEYMKGKNIKSDPISSIEPIVKQLVYSGIHVKKGCVDGLISGFGTDYPTNDDNLEQELLKRSRNVVDNLIKAISENL